MCESTQVLQSLSLVTCNSEHISLFVKIQYMQTPVLRATDEAVMAERPETESQGKAWWVQLQHQRAVDAGCHFYNHRPATSGSMASKHLQATCRSDTQGCKLGRPSTVGSFERSARNSTGVRATLADQHFSCMMRPCISPKLPARRAVLSRQASRPRLSSTAVSHVPPASRGNDWSPVHSRPTTRGAVSNMYEVKHQGIASTKLTRGAGHVLADVLDTASVQQASKHAPILKHSQHRPHRTSSNSNQPSQTVCQCSTSHACLA